MSRRAWLGLLGAAVAVGLVVFAVQRNKKRAMSPITPGPDTTVIAGPLDAAGLIDYETALNEKLKGKSTADTNAVVLLLQVIGPKVEGQEPHPDFYRWLGCSPPPPVALYLANASLYFSQELEGDNAQQFHDHQSVLRSLPWTAEDEPKHAVWVTSHEKPLAAATEAAKRPDYFYPLIARKPDGTRDNLIGAMLPHVQKVREVASILSLRVMLRCGEKKYDAAWDDVMTMHRLARLVAKGGTLIETLTGIALDHIARNSALRCLEAAKPTATQALAWRDELAKLPPFPPLADKVTTSERFTFLDVVQFVRRDGKEALKMFGVTGSHDESWEAVLASMPRTDWDQVLRTGNGWYDRFADALRKPSRDERIAAFKLLNDELNGLRRSPVDFGERLVTLFLPAMDKVSEASDRQEVRFRTEVLAFALAAHFADLKKYPAKLADLVPKYAATIPDDIYSGKPLIYKPTATGYELYSVGTNGKDDGGQSLDDEPRGDDYGVRMPFMKRTPTPGDDRR